MFNNKKILFYGPSNTKDKETIKINNYDIIIITNNMCEIFFNKYNVKPSVLIYLLSNKNYSFNYYSSIQKYLDKINIIFTISQTSKDFLGSKIDVNKIQVLERPSKFNMMNHVPLCLTRMLMHLENYKFELLHIIGCTFYNNPNDMYEKNYQLMVPNHTMHNLPLNIDYLKYFLKDRNNIYVSDELQEILKETNINTHSNNLKTLLLIKRK